MSYSDEKITPFSKKYFDLMSSIYFHIYNIYIYISCALLRFRICFKLLFKACSYSPLPLKLQCFLLLQQLNDIYLQEWAW